MAVLKPCAGSSIHPSGHTLVRGRRCDACEREHSQRQTNSKRRRRPVATSAEQTRRKQVVAAHVALHGYVCPGWECPPHPSMDLTADHITSYKQSTSENGSLQVLCRVCNGRKGSKSGRAGGL